MTGYSKDNGLVPDTTQMSGAHISLFDWYGHCAELNLFGMTVTSTIIVFLNAWSFIFTSAVYHSVIPENRVFLLS